MTRKKRKRRVFFRVLPGNRLSFPVLLNVWEKHHIDKEFEIIRCEQPEILEQIKKGDIVLYSFMTPDLPLIHREVASIKTSGAFIAAGGSHISGEQVLARKIGFDVLFVGPAEETFLKFGLDLLDNTIIEGIYQETEKEGSHALNTYLPISKYFPTIPPLEIMRGCFWKCKYCETNLNHIHYREIESTNAYLAEQKRRKCSRINFISPSSMEYGAPRPRQVNLEKIEALLQLAQSFRFKYIEYGIFPSEIRPDTVTDAGIKILKKYVSNKAVTIGAQSGLDSRLKELQRGHGVEDIERAVDIANANDFLANLDFIIGYPGETQGERELTMEFIKKLNRKYRLKTHLHHFIPLAGTSYAHRFPSYLNPSERKNFENLRKSGIATDGWINNENQVIGYFQWLKHHFPDHYARYH